MRHYTLCMRHYTLCMRYPICISLEDCVVEPSDGAALLGCCELRQPWPQLHEYAQLVQAEHIVSIQRLVVWQAKGETSSVSYRCSRLQFTLLFN